MLPGLSESFNITIFSAQYEFARRGIGSSVHFGPDLKASEFGVTRNMITDGEYKQKTADRYVRQVICLGKFVLNIPNNSSSLVA